MTDTLEVKSAMFDAVLATLQTHKINTPPDRVYVYTVLNDSIPNQQLTDQQVDIVFRLVAKIFLRTDGDNFLKMPNLKKIFNDVAQRATWRGFDEDLLHCKCRLFDMYFENAVLRAEIECLTSSLRG